MSNGAGIWLGDVALAYAALLPQDDAVRVAIARLLGMGATAPAPASINEDETEEQDARPAGNPTKVTAGLDIGDDSARSYSPDALASLPLLSPITRELAGVSGWDAGESLPTVNAGHLTAVPLLEPLLAPRSTSSILYKLLAQEIGDGPIDTDAVVDAVARRRALTEIPREPRGTLRFGAQLLLDVGEGMQPFLRDEQWLAEQVRRVVGTATQIAYFADCPLRGAGPDSLWSWERYRPPHAGTPVLVVSDFGIGGPLLYAERSRPDEWASFAGLLASAECPLVGLVPYPPKRWSVDLASRITLLTMDRGITVGSVIAHTRR